MFTAASPVSMAATVALLFLILPSLAGRHCAALGLPVKAARPGPYGGKPSSLQSHMTQRIFVVNFSNTLASMAQMDSLRGAT